MNHAEWERKVRDLERRIKELQKVGRLGPVELVEVESMISKLEQLLL